MELIKTIVNPDKIETIWIGDESNSDLRCDLYIESIGSIEEVVGIIKENLRDKQIIFRP
jgi:bifunctional enzyme CysN/CysC